MRRFNELELVSGSTCLACVHVQKSAPMIANPVDLKLERFSDLYDCGAN